ncbi:lysozyme family protein [Oceanobacillus profundus]|uniref:lysozyme family protein n=1 Tax=Oceanobacillus TaxID=182709 RepID=UPI0026E38116|nr:lysozyme family protein [Oceanobacillus profundus]MDO6450156.1 lysozyme family protein [Oceanobacillus profundus]
MKLKRKIQKITKQTFSVVFFLIGVFLLVSFLTFEKQEEFRPERSSPLISEEVRSYKPLIETYAKEYGVEDYVDVLQAMMMQESGGRGNDPMQSSESYCGEIGCIKDPELSIKQGVYYFSKTLADADDDLELAIQSYNFGRGFIDYVHAETGRYSQDIAIAFSKEMYENASDPTIYTCLREEAKQYDACYGDIYYVRSVMQYKDVLAPE